MLFTTVLRARAPAPPKRSPCLCPSSLLSGPGKARRRARPLASWSNKPQDHSSPDKNFVAVHSAPPRPRNVAYIKEPSEAGLRFLPGMRLPGWRAGKGGAGAGLAATRDSAPGSPAWVPAPRPPASRTCVRFTGPRGPAARGGPLAELGSWCVLLPCPSRLRGRLEPGGRPAGFEDGGTSLNFPAPGEAVHLE